MSESRMSLEHVAKIHRVLLALGDTDTAKGEQRSVAYAIVVLEDAMIACQLALSFGLSLEGMRAQNLTIIADETRRVAQS